MKESLIMTNKYIIIFILLISIISISVFSLFNIMKQENNFFLVTDINNFSGILKKDFQIIKIPGLKSDTNDFELNATFYIGVGNSYAVITDKKRNRQKLYMIGDHVGRSRLYQIFKGSVILSEGDFKTILKLKCYNKLIRYLNE